MSTVKDAISQAVDRLADELEALSRQIHDHPELAYQEVQGLRLAQRVPRPSRASRSSGAWAGWRPRSAPPSRPARARPSPSCASTTRCPASGTRAATTSSPPRARARARRWPPCKGAAAQGPHPGDRHARRGGRRRQGQADQGRRLQGRGLRHDDPRLRPHDPAPGPARHRARRPSSSPARPRTPPPIRGRASTRWTPCIQTYNAVSMLRQQVRPDCRIHGIITSGGAAANIIPEYAAAIFYVRAPRIDTMWDLYKRVVACAEGAAQATGCDAQGDPARQRLRADEVAAACCSISSRPT